MMRAVSFQAALEQKHHTFLKVMKEWNHLWPSKLMKLLVTHLLVKKYDNFI